MCILCVIQKWSRTVATMLPWLAIPLVGFWALSQLLPPAFRFEITSPRLACVFVLLVTLFWYEILMPQLSVWRAKRNARVREQKRFEAIEMQKLRKSATRRCRNCLTPYKDQNPGGGKFMCSYCGHISKRPVLDLPLPPGMRLSNSGILKDLMGRSGKIFNRKVLADNGWMCGQDWLENGSWASGGSYLEKSSYWKRGGGFLVGDDHCLAEKSCSRVLIFLSKACKTFFLSIIWVWRTFFRISSSRDDVSIDAERRSVIDKRGGSAGNCQESKSEKARRKAEERRQARLEKELLEEEERKQREEVARLVDERRRLRDEKMEAERERGKGSPTVRERDHKKEAEMKRQERKKDKDKTSNKSNSDAEELEKRASKDNQRHRKSDNDRREHPRTGSENVKGYGTGVVHGHKVAVDSNHHRGNVGTNYLNRMKGTFLSSRAFSGGGFFGRGTNVTNVSREHKLNSSVDHSQSSAYRREPSQLDRPTGKPYMNGDENKNTISRRVPQPCTSPKNPWQQLFTPSSSVAPASGSNVIGRPNGNSHSEVHTSQFSAPHPSSTQGFDNPINFGLPSPLSSPSFSFGSTSNSTGLSLSSEAMFPRIGEKPAKFLPEESEIFEDPCYVPDPVSLLGPVSESLDNFQLDVGFVGDTVLEKPSTLKNIHASPEVIRPSPIESPMSRLRVPEERHPFPFPNSLKAQDVNHVPVDDLSNANETGTWQMWSSSPLGPDSLGLFGGSAKWLPQELNGTKKEDPIQPVAPKTMASLFKNDEQVLSEAHSPHNNFIGNFQNGEMYNSVSPVSRDGPWLPNSFFLSASGNENQLSSKLEESTTKGMMYGSPLGSATENQFDIPTGNCWVKKEGGVPSSGDGVGKASLMRPSITGLYSTADVPSLWSYD